MGAINAFDFDDPQQRQQATIVLTQLVSLLKRLLFTSGAENSSNPQLWSAAYYGALFMTPKLSKHSRPSAI